jgi:HTH-type transcriptional regulator, sugar sensing transcriptional regulator
MKNAKLSALLSAIGFSGSEAEVYLALLAEPGASGYRVAQLVGKPAANTYKALDSLRVKGAVVSDGSAGTKSYVALSVREYLDGVRRDLGTRQTEIEAELKHVVTTPLTGGVFQLTSATQVYERVCDLLASARYVALVDVFPAPFERIRDCVAAAAKRGVKVLLKAYEPVTVPGCEIVAAEWEFVNLKVWNGDWLNVAVDCREYVQSFLKKDGAGVHEAIWCRNPYVAALTYSGIANEFVLSRVGMLLREGLPTAEVRDEFSRLASRYMYDTPLSQVIPDSWKTEWVREQEKKSKPADRSRSAGNRSNKTRRLQ